MQVKILQVMQVKFSMLSQWHNYNTNQYNNQI